MASGNRQRIPWLATSARYTHGTSSGRVNRSLWRIFFGLFTHRSLLRFAAAAMTTIRMSRIRYAWYAHPLHAMPAIRSYNYLSRGESVTQDTRNLAGPFKCAASRTTRPSVSWIFRYRILSLVVKKATTKMKRQSSFESQIFHRHARR